MDINHKKQLILSNKLYGNDIAYQIKETYITYNDLYNHVAKFGSYLKNRFKYEKILVIGKNSYEYVVSYYSIICSDNVIVPVDKEIGTLELNNIIEFAEISCVIYDNYCSEKVKLITRNKVKLIKMEEVLKISSNEDERDFYNFDIDGDSFRMLVFTSGTTGDKPKGVMLSSNNVMFTAYNTEAVGLERKDLILLSILPFHHVFESTLTHLRSLVRGGTVIFMDESLNLIENIRKYKPASLIIVPMISKLLYEFISRYIDMTKIEDTGLSKIQKREKYKEVLELLGGRFSYFCSGGAQGKLRVDKFFDNIGITVYFGYGMTETSATGFVNSDGMVLEDYPVGLPLKGVKYKIDSSDGTGVGEILIAGPNVMLGYYKDEEAQKECFSGKYFRTGDIGYVKENRLYVIARLKNVIIADNGKNIYPENIEQIIKKNENVQEVIVKSIIENNKKILISEVSLLNDSETKRKEFEEHISIINTQISSYERIKKVIYTDKNDLVGGLLKVKRNEN